MNNFQKDKKIKLKFNSNDEIPKNINNIYDKFINENINSKSESKVIKFSKSKKIISAVASTITFVLAGGVIYAAVTGKSLIGLFNINEEKYQNDLVSVNEQITDQGITVELTEYAVDHNAIVVNYQISSSSKDLNFVKSKDNIMATTKINESSIELDIDNQKYVENDGVYTVATLYSIEQFEESLNEFEFNIEITEIAGYTGNWNFKINIDKSQIKDNRKYSFYDRENLKDTNRIPLKTNYTPIAMNVGTVSVSDFSTVINMTFFNTQNGVSNDNKIEPKKTIVAASAEANTDEWNETEQFFIEIQNNNGEVLDFEDYDYTRAKMIRYEKIIFPNLSVDCDSLNLKVYLKKDNGDKELVGEIKLELNDSNIEKYNFNISKTLNNGELIYKVPDNWKIDNSSQNSVDILTMDDFGNTVDLSLSYIAPFQYDDFGINKSSSLEEIATNNSNIKYEFSTESKAHKIISKGEQVFENISGYQITYSLKYSNSNVWDTKIKNFYFFVKDSLYLVSITADGEVAVENYIDIFNDFINNIEYENDNVTDTTNEQVSDASDEKVIDTDNEQVSDTANNKIREALENEEWVKNNIIHSSSTIENEEITFAKLSTINDNPAYLVVSSANINEGLTHKITLVTYENESVVTNSLDIEDYDYVYVDCNNKLILAGYENEEDFGVLYKIDGKTFYNILDTASAGKDTYFVGTIYTYNGEECTGEEYSNYFLKYKKENNFVELKTKLTTSNIEKYVK